LLRETPAGVEIDVRVIPRARKTQLAGTREGALLVRLAAPPVDDAANDALIAFLAETLDVPRRSVRVVSGAHSRHKRLAIDGVSAAFVEIRLPA
jgi:uncharacterized protein (TIGR00251 family)